MKLLLLVLSIFSLQYLSAETNNQEKVLKNHQLINILMGEEVFIEKIIPANRSARVIRESRPTREARLTRDSRVSRVIQITHTTQPKKKSSLKACTNTKSSSMQLAKKKIRGQSPR